MATDASRQSLSAQTKGLPIHITGVTAGTANPVHTAVDVIGSRDEVHLYATNIDTTNHDCTVLVAGVGSANKASVMNVPPKRGMFQIYVGTVSSGTTLSVFAETANIINITGHVNRISES